MIPGHKESADEQGGEEDPLFVGLNGEEHKRSGKQKGGGNDQDAAVGIFFLDAVGEIATGEDTK